MYRRNTQNLRPWISDNRKPEFAHHIEFISVFGLMDISDARLTELSNKFAGFHLTLHALHESPTVNYNTLSLIYNLQILWEYHFTGKFISTP